MSKILAMNEPLTMKASSDQFVMDGLKVDRVLNALQESGTEGIGLIRLSRKTRIRMVDLHAFFRAHKKMFEAAGSLAKFRISQRAPYAGDVSLVRSALNEERESQRRKEFMTYGFLYFAMFGGMVVTLFVMF